MRSLGESLSEYAPFHPPQIGETQIICDHVAGVTDALLILAGVRQQRRTCTAISTRTTFHLRSKSWATVNILAARRLISFGIKLWENNVLCSTP
jgi:hypothetical protein